MKKVFLKKIGFSLFVAAAALLWTTCEVGLGEAVDTMAPTVSVSAPAASSVIAGAVTISGVCADDKGIAKVNVVVTNTKTGAKYDYLADVKEMKSWSKTINELAANSGYPLPDGSYTADVTAVDVNGRSSGTSSTAFDIDNTEPIFCVTSPASLDITNPRKYGRAVTISGEIADDHDIAKMNIRVFRTDASGSVVEEITNSLAKTEFTDFETAGGTTVYIAKYFDSEPAATNADGTENLDYKLYKNYMAIYGTTALGEDVYIYVVPTLTDIAGNTSKQCYASTELKNLIASACGVETTIDSLQTAQLQKVYNGTYTLGELSDEQRAKVAALMKGESASAANYYCQYVDGEASKQRPLAADVNSNNSPKYSFSGYELDLSNIEWSEINTGGTLSVSVQSGLDGWGVLPNTIKLYLYRCADTGVEYQEGESLYKKFVSNESEGFEITNALGESISGISTSVSAQSYYVSLPKLSSGEHYILKAEGLDEDGNSLYPIAEKYGLKVASTGAAPKIDFNDRYYIKGSEILTGGSASVVISVNDGTDTINDGQAEHYVKVMRKLYEGHISSKGYLGNYTPTNTAEDTFTTEIEKLSTNEYRVTVPINKYNSLAEGNYTLALEVSAKNSSSETPATYIVWIDHEKPAITISEPLEGGKIFNTDSSVSQDASGNYYYTPYGKWSDRNGSGTSALWYSVTDTGSGEPTISGNATDGWTITGNDNGAGGHFAWTRISGAVAAETETSWEQKLGPVTESTGNFIKFIAVDAVGNISDVVKRSDFTYDFGLPTIALSSEPGASSPVKVKEYYNSYVAASNGKLEFTLTAKDTLALDSTTPITVVAKKYNKTTRVYDTITTETNGYNCEATVGSDSQNASVLVTLDANGTADGIWNFAVSSKDSCGRTSAEISFATTIDRTPPQLDDYATGKPVVIKGNGLLTDWYKDETLSVTGKFTEAESGSGVYRIYYWLGTPTAQKSGSYVVPSDLTVAGSYDGYIAISSSANTGSGVAYTIAPAGFEEMQYTDEGAPLYNNLYIQTIDIAGNKSALLGPLQVMEDRAEPVFEAKYYTYDDAAFSAANGTAVSNGNNDMTLYGTVSDALSAVKEITFAIGDSSVSPEITYTIDDLSGAVEGADYKAKNYVEYASISEENKTKITGWKAIVAKANLTSGSLYAKAADRAGNSTSSQKLFDLDIDKDSPTITLTTPVTKLFASKYVEGGSSKSGSDSNDVAAVNGTISVSGTASDNYLQSVAVYVGTDSTTEIVSGDTRLQEFTGTAMYNWSVSNKFSYIESGEFKFSDGSTFTGTGKDIYIKVLAKDSAANERVNVYKYSVNPDSDRPVLKLFKPLNGMTSADENYMWVTNDTSITGSISDDDGINEITATYKLYDSATSTWGAPVEATVTNSNGSFQVSGLKDGMQIITFTVIDGAGTIFAAHDSGTSSWLAPKISGNDATPETYGTAADSDTLLYIKVDNSLPQSRNVLYSYYDESAASPAYSGFSSTLETLGGKRSKLKIQFEAFDENGINSVKFSMTDGITAQDINGTIDSANPASDGYVTCTISDILINSGMTKLASGTYPATVEVTDKAGLKSTSTYNITIDNDAPQIKMTAPTNTVSGSATAYGSVDKSAVSYGMSINNTDAPVEYKSIETSLSWFIYFDGDINMANHDVTLKDYLIALSVTTQEAIDNGTYTNITPLYLWMEAVDDVGNETVEKFKISVDPQGDKPTVEINNPSANGSTAGGKIRLYGSASDNEEVKAVFVQIISGEYHDISVKASGTYGNYIHAGGTAEVTGFNLTADDLNYLKAVKYKSGESVGQAVYKIYKMATYDPDDSSTCTEWNGSGTPSDYGILANLNAGKSWYLNINANDEFADTTKTNGIAMRVFAVDKIRTSGGSAGTANVSQGVLRQMSFDANAPTITTPNVRKYDVAVTGNAAYASTEGYKEDMYARGETWLSFTAHDTSAIGSLEIGLSKTSAADAVSAKTSITLPSALDVDAKTGSGVICLSPSTYDGESATLNQYINVLAKLDTASGVGTQYIYVYIVDTGGTPSQESYVIKFDNTAPEIANVTSKDYNITPSVQQSNGWYSFGSKVSEADIGSTKQSGFKRLAFYFMRRDITASGTPTYIYDPMIKKGATGNKLSVSDSLTYSDGLYWIKQPVTRTATGNTITLSSSDENIHPYGLAKIGGTIYTITSVAGTTVVVDGDPEGTSGATETAYFAIGNVVDHMLTESSAGNDLTGDGYKYGYNKPGSDDGDYMVESVKQDGTDWTWSASVYSKNIPDGPIELHYVAFDAAGNYVKGIMGCVDLASYKAYETADAVDAAKASPAAPISVYAYAQTAGSTIYEAADKAAFVSNNAPRLANLFAGTDLDGDDEVSEEEITAQVYASSLTDWSSAKSSLALGKDTAAAITAKGRTVVRPEIIGGNGALYYSFKISGADASGNAYTISGNNATVFMAADTGNANSREDQAESAKKDITLPVGDFVNLAHDSGSANTSKGILDCAASAPAAFELTFWDSTEVTTKFVNSQTAKATVYMGVAMTDSVAPTIDIEPLYWNELTDNSIYDSGNASTYASLKGHMELPADLESTNSWTSPFTASSGEMDKDPKVSGIITLKGSVSDNKMLGKVYMSVTNGTYSMDIAFDSVKQAAVDETHCKTSSGTAVSAYPLAKYSGGSWTVADDLADHGVKFEISDSEITESGHTANWTLVWDTSFVSNYAATDLNVRIFASDQVSTAATGTAQTSVNGSTKYAAPSFADNKFSAGSDTPTGETKTSYYKLDVVPYITALETTMTGKGAVYGRTSTGRYPVYFYKNSNYGVNAEMTTEAGANITVKGFNLAAKNASITKTVNDSGADITQSVDYVVTVNGVQTLNNLNNDDAKGDYGKTTTAATGDYNVYKNYYNRQPNKSFNNLLTDNVGIDVWQINNKAAVPLRGIANDVTMKVNQQSKMLGFAFVNGPLNFALPNGEVSSYTNWALSYDFCKSATLAIDDGGRAYGTVAGGDTGDNYADAFGLYASQWGTGDLRNDHGTQKTTQGQRRLESVGQSGSKTMSVAGAVYTNTDTDNPTGNQTDQWRIVSPSIATTYRGDSTNIYLAYYDEMNDEIRFRAGSSVPGTAQDFGNFIDRFEYNDQVYTKNSQDVQIVAQANTPKKPGPYVSIAASNKSGSDVVVMVWHDPENNCMWYSYNTTPTTSRANTINNQVDPTTHGWSTPETVFSGVTGEFCQVAFDKEGKVHIAAFDSGGSDLWYAYLADYANPGDAKTCVVDSYGATGTQITLDVAYSKASGGAPIPYIGYFVEGKSLPKLAYYAGSDITSDKDISGVENDLFTGRWEATVVPTVTSGIQGEKGYDRINVGVWKSDGVISYSSGGNSYYVNTGNNGDSTSYGVVYGNGTANPALGYRYENGSDGYVEMAQKK